MYTCRIRVRRFSSGEERDSRAVIQDLGQYRRDVYRRKERDVDIKDDDYKVLVLVKPAKYNEI